jgi:hypothetical protein
MEEIPKGGDWDETPGPAWFPCRDSKGNPIKPLIKCRCGTLTGIGLHHVHADGTVTASFYHKRGTTGYEDPRGCEWHVYLKLKDYDQGDFPPGS